jgi:hypothetical protein
MSSNPIHRAAKAEMKRLSDELLASSAAPLFAEYLEAQAIVAKFDAKAANISQDIAGPPQRAHVQRLAKKNKDSGSRANTEAAQVVEGAKGYLSSLGERATSTRIYGALAYKGVKIGGKEGDGPSRVSAYLSAAKDTFDNVRGQGYGLREWNDPAHRKGLL